ncbi:unnamed protein product [Paramecium primaurelia]|uniref:Nucleosome assembly protein n=2 Tax=Paramecium TaxID=5884 RepID=A0A8S1YCM8_9CILI|nr:unnamed protein product [Paramecium primaurelia]CAD8209592.1 unnamed protein product [Paramecium pentaurelia]
MSDHENSNIEEVITKIKTLPVAERVKAVALFYHLKRKQQYEEELEEQVQKLTIEYDHLNLPLYQKQNELILGQRAATDIELSNSDKFLSEAEKAIVAENNIAEPIDDYWFKVLKNSVVIADVCQDNEKDWDVLKSLQKVELDLEENSHNFTIKLTFAPNDYFTNTVLTKRFIFEKAGETPVKSESTHIEWKEGKNVTQKKVSKKQKNKKTGAARTVDKVVDTPSFFGFFKDFDLTNKKDLDDEEVEKQEDLMNEHFDIATEFLDSIVPCSIELFLGLQPEMAELDDDEENDDEDDEDDDDDEDDKKKSKRKKSSSSKGDKNENKKTEKPECKQQ